MKISKFNSFYYEAAFSASATAYFNQVTSNGGSLTNAEKTYINTFIGALGTDFSEFDRLWIHGLSNSVAARTSLANPTSTMITAVNSPTFTTSVGYTGNGTTSYLNTNYNFSTGTKYTLNSGSYGVYSNTAGADMTCVMGVIDSPRVSRIYPKFSGSAFFSINQAGDGSGVFTAATKTLSAVRTLSNAISYHVNGVQTLTASTASTSIPSLNVFVLGCNANGSLSGSTYRVSSSFIGSGAINQLNFSNALQALGTSIGWAV